MLRKANQKRSLDELVIQKGEFDWRSLFGDEAALAKALGEFEDSEDAHAAAVAAREEFAMEGADEADFGGDVDTDGPIVPDVIPASSIPVDNGGEDAEPDDGGEDLEEQLEGGTTVDYMLSFVGRDYEFFRDWRL
jgi:helicase SWR1